MLIEEYRKNVTIALEKYIKYCNDKHIGIPDHRCADLEYYKELLNNKEIKVLQLRKAFIKRYEQMTVNAVASRIKFFDFSALRYYLKEILFSPRYSKERLRNAHYKAFMDKFSSSETIPEELQKKLDSLGEIIEVEREKNRKLLKDLDDLREEKKVMENYIKDAQEFMSRRNIQFTSFDDYKKCFPCCQGTENTLLAQEAVSANIPSLCRDNTIDENSVAKELTELRVTVQKLVEKVEELDKANKELVAQNMALASKNRNENKSPIKEDKSVLFKKEVPPEKQAFWVRFF
jgi:hypothetical protein